MKKPPRRHETRWKQTKELLTVCSQRSELNRGQKIRQQEKNNLLRSFDLRSIIWSQYSKLVSISSGPKERLPREQRLTRGNKLRIWQWPTVGVVRIHGCLWFHVAAIVEMSWRTGPESKAESRQLRKEGRRVVHLFGSLVGGGGRGSCVNVNLRMYIWQLLGCFSLWYYLRKCRSWELRPT